MIYEERTTVVKRGAVQEYRSLCKSHIWPDISQAGGTVLCLLAGQIGASAHELVQITGFSDARAWVDAQASRAPHGAELIEHEEVRLLRHLGYPPNELVTSDGRRDLCAIRRFLVAPEDVSEFVECSLSAIQPFDEAVGASVLGLWATAASTSPQEIVLLTGWRNLQDRSKGRPGLPKPDHVDQELWERSERMWARRNAVVLNSWVKIMGTLEFLPADGG